MGHVIESAASGRAKCRGCGEKIAKGEWRLGERLPNPFGEGEMTLWFHLPCGAYKRPEVLIEALDGTAEPIDDPDGLRALAQPGIDHRRLPRIDGVQRAASARARCRSCRERIDKDVWRIPLVYYQEGRFEASGFIHVACASTYFETTESVTERLRHFGGELSDEDSAEIDGIVEAASAG